MVWCCFDHGNIRDTNADVARLKGIIANIDADIKLRCKKALDEISQGGAQRFSLAAQLLNDFKNVLYSANELSEWSFPQGMLISQMTSPNVISEAAMANMSQLKNVLLEDSTKDLIKKLPEYLGLIADIQNLAAYTRINMLDEKHADFVTPEKLILTPCYWDRYYPGEKPDDSNTPQAVECLKTDLSKWYNAVENFEVGVQRTESVGSSGVELNQF